MKTLAILLATLNVAAQPIGTGKLTMLHRDMPSLGDARQAGMPTGFTPAPTPNSNMYAPRSGGGPAQTHWQPDIAPDQYQVIHPGSGWIPGSAFTDDRGRRHPGNPLGITPTLNLMVPLD
jgi:hypothetical protein